MQFVLYASLSFSADLIPGRHARLPAESARARAPVSKFVGAALAAAFASKDDPAKEELSLTESEEQVSVRARLP